MSIKIQSIHKKFGQQKALNGINLNFNKGEIIGLLGPNGAGKTTLMRIITGYLNPSEGKVEIDNLNIQNSNLKHKIGYLPESNPLYQNMYVREYLGFISEIHKLPSSRVSEVIKQTGLSREAHKKIHQLSKGYKQRVGIAQALIHEPEVLILDEPISGLDPNQINDIRELIQRVSKNKTVILSTHILQEVKALCNRIVILKKGEIVSDQKISEIDNVEELFKTRTLD